MITLPFLHKCRINPHCLQLIVFSNFKPLFPMGNATSCAPLITSSSAGAVKVLSEDGKLEMFARPVKAAELMVQNPGRFVCDSGGLKVGHRIHGLYADEELQRRHLYFLLPMDLLYSVLTDEEMFDFNSNASRALKHSNNFSRIVPVVLGELCIFPFEHTAARRVGAAANNSTPPEVKVEPVERYISKQKSCSWRPALETILETPCRLS